MMWNFAVGKLASVDTMCRASSAGMDNNRMYGLSIFLSLRSIGQRSDGWLKVEDYQDHAGFRSLHTKTVSLREILCASDTYLCWMPINHHRHSNHLSVRPDS